MSETVGEDVKIASLQRRQLLEAVIYFATVPKDGVSERMRAVVPSTGKLVYHEMVRAVVEYVRGKAIEYTHKPYGTAPDGSQMWDPENDYFEENLWRHLDAELKVQPGQLPVELETMIKDLLNPDGTPAMNGERDRYKSELEMHFHGNGTAGICVGSQQDAFLLPKGFFERVEQTVLPAIPQALRHDIEAIGSYVRKYINKDLDAARSHKYPWKG
ncbi:MAG: hypothetical protein AABY13_01290 [Nanoarchaeota archaeon]